MLTDEKETQWTGHQIMIELQTMNSEPIMGQEDSKEENVVELSNEEQPVFKRGKLIKGNPAMRIMSATKARGRGTSTFTLEDNPMDSIIRDLMGMRSRIAEYELQMQQMGKIVGNPPWKKLIAAVHEAIQDPRQLRELESKVDCLTAENQKTLEQLRKLEEIRQELLKQVKEATITV